MYVGIINFPAGISECKINVRDCGKEWEKNRIPKKKGVNPGPSGNFFECVVMDLYRFYIRLLLYVIKIRFL